MDTGSEHRTTRRVLSLGLVAGVGWLVVHLAEGLVASNGVPLPGGALPDRAALVWQMALYLAGTALSFWAFWQVLALARADALGPGPARLLAVAIPIVLAATLVWRSPRLSQDVFSYVAHGGLAETSGANPLLHGAREMTGTDLGRRLLALGWTGGGDVGISPYGVLWTRIEMAVVHLTHDAAAAVVLLKWVVLLASLGSAALIWTFAGKAAPGTRLVATLGYLWNPLIAFELAGEGHNDALMILFVLAALTATAARRPVAAGVALVLGALSKYLPLLLAPPHLVYLWRTRRSTARLVVQVLLACAVGACIAAWLYAPLWVGLDSFRGIRERADPISSASPFGALNWVLRRFPGREVAGPLTLLLVGIPVGIFLLWQSFRVRDLGTLARSCAWISLVCLLGAAPDYWPWYSCLPVALLLAGYSAATLVPAFVISLCARLIAPLNVMFVNGALGMRISKGLTTFVGATLPLLLLLVWCLGSSRHATAHRNDLAQNSCPKAM